MTHLDEQPTTHTTGRRPLLLDLFSGAGGSAVGYHRAGFDVVGVDNRPQPRYPFTHVVADALEYLTTADLSRFDAIHASPPCQDHSPLRSVAGEHGTGWMLDATRERLKATGLPYVLENVEAANMPGSLVLCGTEFGLTVADESGRQRWLKRHRRFESNVFLMGAGGCNCRRRLIAGVYGHGGGEPRTQVSKGGRRRGGYQLAAEPSRQILDVSWMNRDEAAQAIPPTYAQFIGEQLLAHLSEDTHAA